MIDRNEVVLGTISTGNAITVLSGKGGASWLASHVEAVLCSGDIVVPYGFDVEVVLRAVPRQDYFVGGADRWRDGSNVFRPKAR